MCIRDRHCLLVNTSIHSSITGIVVSDPMFDFADKHEMTAEDKALVSSNLESMLTLYCKSRSISYDRDAGWTHILRILVALSYTKAELYNCFYAITTKYIPRSVGSVSYLHCVSKKVPTFKHSVTLSNLNRFSKFLHCRKAYEICYKTHMTLPISP